MRRSVRRNQLSVALFPFLAVLICTMGALIVLLVLMVQQARVHARTLAAEEAAESQDDAEEFRHRLEEAQWKRELLEQSRAEKAAEIADSRAKLAHLEEHIESLKQQAQSLLERARLIDKGQPPQQGALTAAQEELARLQAEIARKESELDAQRAKLKKQERWYALLPYEGPNGTRRRPIYIECTELGIVIQPEGLVLMASDFNGPLGPGNPLDAALRTIREHLQRTTGGQLGEPYPLLVVRPSGVLAHNVARAALKAWDDEFGYELVSEDKKLAFGAPDPVLASHLEKTVALARQRQAAIAAMMPRRYRNDDPLTSFAVDEVAERKPSHSAQAGRGLGNGSGETGTGSASGGGASGRVPIGGVAGTQPRTQHNPYIRPENGSSPLAASTAPAPGASLNGPVAGGPGPSAVDSSRSSPPDSGDGVSSATGGSQMKDGRPGGSQFGSSAGNMAGPSLSPPGNSSSGAQGSPAGSVDGNSAQPGSSAAARRGRGPNWGLQGGSPRSTAVTRPIHLAVLADRIVIVPERGIDRLPQHLPLSPQMTPEEIDRFVAAIQREMKSWGLAVANGYWKPLLQVEVAPDAEHHLAALTQALEGSGFDIERKQP